MKAAPKTAKKAPPARKQSEVRAFAAGTVIGNFYIWTSNCPAVKADPDIMFGRCLVLPGSTETKFRCRQVEPKADPQEYDVEPKDTYNTNDATLEGIIGLHDIGNLTHQNVAAVLDFLKRRWGAKCIYTTADPLLIAVNPFRDLGLVTDAVAKKYRESLNFDSLPPHVFRLARECLEDFHTVGKSQTIIVTGESGAGKTEATKHVMQFFASQKSGVSDARIQTAVMSANPILEAFGNAKTIRNNNSSRFGRFMQLTIGTKGGIENGLVRAFLLEKVRVVSQEKDERAYHIFYQLVKSSNDSIKKKFDLMSLKEYCSLNDQSGGCYDVPGVDDVAEWKEVLESFTKMGLDQESIDSICRIVSSVMLICNAKPIGQTIDGQDDAAKLDNKAKEYLKRACALIQLPVDRVEEEICSTVQKIGTETVKRRLQVKDATVMLQSLAKALYEKLFLWIIDKLNSTIKPEGEMDKFVGMLDIFGFEVFEHNSLEQLLINITNEFLQKNFIDIVFEKEQKLYANEGVPTGELKFTSNQHVIDLLIGKDSVFTSLEDCCLAPGGNDDAFVGIMNRKFEKHEAFSKWMRGREPMFIICHSVADILYNATGFQQKNTDILKPALMDLVQNSSEHVVSQLFAGIVFEKGKLAKGQLIASQFIRSLRTLMDVILATEMHFIRCVKPNETKGPNDWNAAKVLNQLFSLSILEALQLKQVGFAYKRPYGDFCVQFRYLDMEGVDSDRDRQEVAERIVKIGKFDPKEYAFGKSMMFMKPDAAKALAHKQREKMEEWKTQISLIEACLMFHLRLGELKAIQKYVIRVQANQRMQLSSSGVVKRDVPLPPPTKTGAHAAPPKPKAQPKPSKPISQAPPPQPSSSPIEVDPWFNQFIKTSV